MELYSLYNFSYQRKNQFNMEIAILEHPPVKEIVNTVS